MIVDEDLAALDGVSVNAAGLCPTFTDTAACAHSAALAPRPPRTVR